MRQQQQYLHIRWYWSYLQRPLEQHSDEYPRKLTLSNKT